jgi:hypothetical protein
MSVEHRKVNKKPVGQGLKQRLRYLSRDDRLTICIGQICDKGQKVILVSDRMLTEEEFLMVNFEHKTSKQDELSLNCASLVSGSSVLHTDLIRAVKEKHIDSIPPIQIVVEDVKEEMQKLRRKIIEDSYFKPRGYTMEWFNENQRGLSDEVVYRLDKILEDYDIGLEFLVAGVDRSGGHVYYVTNPGTIYSYDSLGWASIGSGEGHSDITFIDSEYTSNVPLKKAIYIGYKAKKRSEIAPGVGKKFTDITIIDNAGPTRLNDKQINALNKIYEIEKSSRYTEEVKKRVEALDIGQSEKEEDEEKD